MSVVASIDLRGAASVELVSRAVSPSPQSEARISLHLPMDLGLFAQVLGALAALDFEFDKTVPDPQRGAGS